MDIQSLSVVATHLGQSTPWSTHRGNGLGAAFGHRLSRTLQLVFDTSARYSYHCRAHPVLSRAPRELVLRFANKSGPAEDYCQPEIGPPGNIGLMFRKLTPKTPTTKEMPGDQKEPAPEIGYVSSNPVHRRKIRPLNRSKEAFAPNWIKSAASITSATRRRYVKSW